MGDISRTIRDNIGLIKKLLQQYGLLDDPEAESAAYEALWRAVVDFNEALGYKLSTLVTVYTKRSLNTHLRTKSRVRQLQVVSYDNTTGDMEFGDLLHDPSAYIEDYLIRSERMEQLSQVCREELDRLSGAKRQIVDIWLREGGEVRAQELADRVGVSQPHVSNTLAQFKNRVRVRLKEVQGG